MLFFQIKNKISLHKFSVAFSLNYQVLVEYSFFDDLLVGRHRMPLGLLAIFVLADVTVAVGVDVAAPAVEFPVFEVALNNFVIVLDDSTQPIESSARKFSGVNCLTILDVRLVGQVDRVVDREGL